MADWETKELKDAFFNDLALEKAKSTRKEEAPTADKPKPKLKKKVADDPFVSDDDNKGGEEGKGETVQAGTSSQAKRKPKKKAVDDEFVSDGGDDAEEEEKRKREVKVKNTLSSSKRRQSTDDDDDDEVDRPRGKKLGRTKT